MFIFFFGSCGRASFLQRFVIDFWMYFDNTFDVFRYLFHSCTQPTKPSITLVFRMKSNDFIIQENIILNYFHEFLRYEFWHWFLMSFGTDFATILAPLLNTIQCFLEIFFWLILDRIFAGFGSKLSLKTLHLSHPFCVCFRPLSAYLIIIIFRIVFRNRFFVDYSRILVPFSDRSWFS